ncbi:hypothetical protein D3C76_1781490 [compost metagenome]
MALEAPHVSAGTAEAWLHLVGDEQATGGAHGFHRFAEEPSRVGKYAIAGEQRVYKQCRRANAMTLHVDQGSAYLSREQLANPLRVLR